MAAINPLRWLKAEDADDLSKDERTKQMRKRLFLVLGVAAAPAANRKHAAQRQAWKERDFMAVIAPGW